MDRQRNYSDSQGEIVRYEVDIVDGKFVKTPIFNQQPEVFTAHIPIEEVAPDRASSIVESVPNRPRNFRGKSLATASLFFAGLLGVTYGSDAAVTYVKENKIISPLDAYQDFTELPHLVGPIVDTIQTVTNIANN